MRKQLPPEAPLAPAVRARLPDLVIIGAPRCATTSLFDWLTGQEGVQGVRHKDAFYFMDRGSYRFQPQRNHLAGGLAGYAALFPERLPGTRCMVDSCALYLYQEAALEQLPELPSQPVFLAIVRPPEEQIVSLYNYLTNFETHLDPRRVPLERFVELALSESPELGEVELLRYAIRYARYIDQLRAWRARVGPERLFVCTLADVLAAPARATAPVLARFAIRAHDPAAAPLPDSNRAYFVRSQRLQKLNERVRAVLPRGRLYDALRRGYRALNTSPAPSAGAAAAAVKSRLRTLFADPNARLEAEFGVRL